MTATNHALTGAAIATVLQQPYLVLPLAFISHFVCDAIPHFGMKFKFGSNKMWTYLFIEGAAMLLLAAILLGVGTRQPIIILILSAVLAMSPDFAWYVYGLRGQLGKVETYSWLNKFHSKIQWSETKLGIIIEIAWAAMMVQIIV